MSSAIFQHAPRAVLFGGIFILLVAGAQAADFPQWRGPNRDGQVATADVASWPEKLTQSWQVQVGEGHASPIVAGGTVFAFSREGEREVVRGLKLADGREQFRQDYDAPYKMHSAATGHGKGPKSTPTAAAGRLYTFGISGILSCWNAATGELLWRREFADRFKNTSPLYGAAASPLIVDGLCIVHVGGHDAGAVTAFDAKTGEPRWSWGEDGPAYASPVVAEIHGVRQVITQSQRFCLGLDVKSGKLLWKTPLTTPYDQNSVTPLVLDDGRVLFGGYDQPTFALKLAKAAPQWKTEVDWENGDIAQYMSSPVLAGDAVFGMTHRDSGRLFAADAASGEILWQGEPRLGDNAAILVAGDAVLVLTTDSQLTVLKRGGDGYVELRRYQVADSATWAHPALVGDSILVKDATTLTRWKLK